MKKLSTLLLIAAVAAGNGVKAMLYMYSCHSADMNPYAHGKGDHRQGPLLGTKHPIAYVMAQKFKFYGVRDTAESVNYHSFWTDFTLPTSKDSMRPYPANGGKWKVFYNPNNPLRRERNGKR